ncbi:MAG: bifunctional (p)ppGpp synthetase/guanosine-3',5'-bis(diphosphate) 3'-pyrophosphohydrolase, partial [Candidatus Scalindua sp.]
NDIQKPSVRMWLFGMITIVEIFIARTIEIKHPQSAWRRELSPERLKKAEDLQNERKRRDQHVTLLDCLQLGDKAKILMKDPEMREDMGFESKRTADKALKDFESLRNNLAHAQDIITYNWESIVTISRRLNKIMTRI